MCASGIPDSLVDLLQPLAAQVAVLGLGLLEERDEPPFLAHEVLVLEAVPPMGVHKDSEVASRPGLSRAES